MEKDNKNKGYVLHAVPPKHAPQFQEMQVKEIIEEQDTRQFIGAKYLDNNQVAVYINEYKHGLKKAVYDCQSKEKISEKQYSMLCTLCKTQKVSPLKAIVQGDYLITCEMCTDSACHKTYAQYTLERGTR